MIDSFDIVTSLLVSGWRLVVGCSLAALFLSTLGIILDCSLFVKILYINYNDLATGVNFQSGNQLAIIQAGHWAGWPAPSLSPQTVARLKSNPDKHRE
jgi:hypothetical protein